MYALFNQLMALSSDGNDLVTYFLKIWSVLNYLATIQENSNGMEFSDGVKDMAVSGPAAMSQKSRPRDSTPKVE